jgi:hypothetical protein
MARGTLDRLPPAAVNWTLIAYALVLCVGIWGLVVQRIQSDHRSTLQTEREHLRSISSTLQAQVEAMLGDGVGAALAAANELENRTDISTVGDTQVSDTLTHMLTGGPYVRSLFLIDSQRFVRVGRSATPDRRTVPPTWLLPVLNLGSEDAWVGALIAFSSLERAYEQPESRSGVGLFTNDGAALFLLISDARVRAAEGSNIGDSEMFRRIASGPASGVIDGIGPFAGVPAIAA